MRPGRDALDVRAEWRGLQHVCNLQRAHQLLSRRGTGLGAALREEPRARAPAGIAFEVDDPARSGRCVSRPFPSDRIVATLSATELRFGERIPCGDVAPLPMARRNALSDLSELIEMAGRTGDRSLLVLRTAAAARSDGDIGLRADRQIVRQL